MFKKRNRVPFVVYGFNIYKYSYTFKFKMFLLETLSSSGAVGWNPLHFWPGNVKKYKKKNDKNLLS